MAKLALSSTGAVFLSSQAKARVHLRVDDLKKSLKELVSTEKHLPEDLRFDAQLESLVRDLKTAADALCDYLSKKK